MEIIDTTDWIESTYTYRCPAGQYLDTSTIEEVEGLYYGPEKLHVIVEKETGVIYDVLLDKEINDGRPTPFNHTVITLNANEDPLIIEVLSDYHNNFTPEDMVDGHLELRQITIDGYGSFDYTYPIHPDELYDDSKSYYDWDTKEFVLYQNINEDIIGAFPGWERTRERRDFWLYQSDIWLLNPILTDEQKEEINVYKQLLRDFPQVWADSEYDDIFADSCWPIKPSFVERREP